MAEADSRSLGTNTPALLLAMLAGALLCGSFFLQNQLLWLGISLLLLTAAALLSLRRRKKRKALEAKYGSGNPQLWRSLARDYEAAQGTYEEALARWTRRRAALEAAVSREIPQSGDPQAAVSAWEALARARSDCRQAEAHAKALAAMAKPAPPPRFPDYRAESPAETHNRLAAIREERSALSRRLGQCQGQMEALGDKASLLSRLSALEERIRKLEQTYAALTLAQETLDKAKAELQRRFAPEITRQTQAFFSRLTGGRYHRLTLGRDLALTVAAPEETILRAPLWRSDGTADQLYLALRLAVSKALIPQAPFVLDDALARFDDTRLAAAMTILKQEADSRQILLFTCQSREAQYL